MQIEQLIIRETASVLDAMHKLDETGHTILFIAPEGVLQAVVTDSDVRRHILKGGKLGRIGGIGGGDELRAVGERLVEKTHDHFATRAFKGALFKRDEHVKGVGGNLVHGFSLTDRGAERR